MKKDFFVECWLFGQQINARIVEDDFQVYRQYHPVILSGIAPVDLKDYYFISSYDGTLELNQVPNNELAALLMKELADAISLYLDGCSAGISYYQPFRNNHLPGGSPSAAA